LGWVRAMVTSAGLIRDSGWGPMGAPAARQQQSRGGASHGGGLPMFSQSIIVGNGKPREWATCPFLRLRPLIIMWCQRTFVLADRSARLRPCCHLDGADAAS
jgi:hypothetical protein